MANKSNALRHICNPLKPTAQSKGCKRALAFATGMMSNAQKTETNTRYKTKPLLVKCAESKFVVSASISYRQRYAQP